MKQWKPMSAVNQTRPQLYSEYCHEGIPLIPDPVHWKHWQIFMSLLSSLLSGFKEEVLTLWPAHARV